MVFSKQVNLILGKIIALIPARGGSKAIPKKNIKMVNGHPLIAYSIAACNLCQNVSRTVVSTDCEEIAEIARAYGAEVPFMRPKEFAGDLSPDKEFLNHFFDNIDVEEIALMRPTTPLRSLSVMEDAIKIYFENKNELSSLRTVNETSSTPYKLFKIKNNYCEGFFDDYDGIEKYNNLPRQFFPQTYEANGHIDILKQECVRADHTFGNKIYAYICDEIIDIDLQVHFDMLKYAIEEDNILLKHLNKWRNK